MMLPWRQPPPTPRDCVAIEKVIPIIVIPAKAGIQNLLIILDSPVSGTGQAHRRASLARNDKKAVVCATQSPTSGGQRLRRRIIHMLRKLTTPAYAGAGCANKGSA